MPRQQPRQPLRGTLSCASDVNAARKLLDFVMTAHVWPASLFLGAPGTLLWRAAAVLLLSASFTAGQDCSSPSSRCYTDQQTALTTLYDSLGGPGWRSHGQWLTTAHHCTWSGVYCCICTGGVRGNYFTGSASCSAPCSVIGLNLGNNNLVGQLSSLDSSTVWTALDTLVFLDIQGLLLSAFYCSSV